MIAVIFAISGLPVILLALRPSAVSRWIAFGLVLLLFLFHAIHIAEHAMYGEYAGAGLILLTGLVPYALVLYMLFRMQPDEAST